MELSKLSQLKEVLLSAQRPVFIADRKLDGDSLGASLALADWMESMKKPVQVYIEGELPETYQEIPCTRYCTTDRAIFSHPDIDVIVTFDCSSAAFIQSLLKDVRGTPTVVNIDHHATNPLFGTMNIVDVHAPATTEIVYRFFEVNNIRPSKDAATLLFLGLAFDTDHFSNSGTTDRAFDVGSQLVSLGARVGSVLSAVYGSRQIDALKLWAIVLERVSENKEERIVYTYLKLQDFADCNVKEEAVSGISDFLNFVTKAESIFFFREYEKGLVRVSMRSKKRNVGEIAKVFGGGGHTLAAGCAIPNASLESPESVHALVLQCLKADNSVRGVDERAIL